MSNSTSGAIDLSQSLNEMDMFIKGLDRLNKKVNGIFNNVSQKTKRSQKETTDRFKTLENELTDFSRNAEKSFESLAESAEKSFTSINNVATRSLRSIKQELNSLSGNISLNLDIKHNGPQSGSSGSGGWFDDYQRVTEPWRVILNDILTVVEIVGVLGSVKRGIVAGYQWVKKKTWGKPAGLKNTPSVIEQVKAPLGGSSINEGTGASSKDSPPKNSSNKGMSAEQKKLNEKQSRLDQSIKTRAAKIERLESREKLLTRRERAELNSLRVAQKNAIKTNERYAVERQQLTQATTNSARTPSANKPKTVPNKGNRLFKGRGKAAMIATGLVALGGGLGASLYSSGASASDKETPNDEESSGGFLSDTLSFGASMLARPGVMSALKFARTGLRVARLATPIGWASLAAEAFLTSDFVTDKISSWWNGSDDDNNAKIAQTLDVGPPRVSPGTIAGTSKNVTYNFHNNQSYTINTPEDPTGQTIKVFRPAIDQSNKSSEKAMINYLGALT